MQKFLTIVQTICGVILLAAGLFFLLDALDQQLDESDHQILTIPKDTNTVHDIVLEIDAPLPDQYMATGEIDQEVKAIDAPSQPRFDPLTYLTYTSLNNLKTEDETKIDVPQDLPLVQVKSDASQELEGKQNLKIDLPDSVLLEAPFYSQAPDGNRNQPRQDACEEASIILGAYGLNKKHLSQQKFTQEILTLVELQDKMFGSYVDTTIAQTKELYDTYYDIGTSTILDQPSIQDLQYEVAQGHMIVAPFAGKRLGNSHYSNGGPRYHMMLIVGYDETHFVTHDVGTRLGKNYRYTHQVIADAIHDFVPIADGSITKGASRVLVLKK